MLPFTKINKKYALLGVALLLVMGISAYYVLYRPFYGGENPIILQETEVAKQDSKIKITNNTEIVQKILYLKCNEEEVLKTKPTENLIGLTIYQMQKIYEGWDFEKFDTNEAVMTLKVDGYCREHANNIFIGIKDNHVAVFYGRPGYKPIVKEITAIQVNKLMPQDIEELQKGMVVQSKEELLRTLEGMQSR
ncbi:BofC C-terminal domain-containing protein [Pelosinus propionicus]|uniref:BofC C-terminal domain-containing protein n=1 Tax=Pelosinus propionicus DSM 13327 TaxID=1123291 RepID=A0A1I4KTU5_9FIRM|nr:BofC C-terminal domain-containing protein [Pelosinus propionicus]SFL82140.1 BofC C-terminal domain-containing protein [Pelosinus propionicus DSM 13327]